MNRRPEQNDNRFSGGLRHYHRPGADQQRSWDDWVEGSARQRTHSWNWWKIIGILVAILALGGIVAGLIIELR